MKKGRGNPLAPRHRGSYRLLKSLLTALGKRRDEQFVISGGIQPFGELRWRRDDERAALPLDESFSREAAEHERHRFACRADQLAQQAVRVDAGHAESEAGDLAQLCISSIEGAITLARVRRSTRPVELVQESLIRQL